MAKSTRSYGFVQNILPLAFLLLLLFLFFVFSVTRQPQSTKLAAPGAARARARSPGDCQWEEEMETKMESEASRRVLKQAQRYISYEFLRGDAVPCSRQGVPYYNCYALPKAGPYSRGCLTITRCARDSAP